MNLIIEVNEMVAKLRGEKTPNLSAMLSWDVKDVVFASSVLTSSVAFAYWSMSVLNL
jgi:hypothetical protein